MDGWIKLHREIMQHWIWNDTPFDKRSAWIYMLMMANHDDNKFMFDGQFIEVKRGSFITSIRKLCDYWGWSNTKVTKFLKILKTDSMIEYLSDKKKTVITIVNYGVYQGKDVTETSQKRH